jgi:hypothetical protein
MKSHPLSGDGGDGVNLMNDMLNIWSLPLALTHLPHAHVYIGHVYITLQIVLCHFGVVRVS